MLRRWQSTGPAWSATRSSSARRESSSSTYSTSTPWSSSTTSASTWIPAIRYTYTLDTHRLNMEVDLQSLFGLHVTWCAQLYSLAETRQLPPHLDSYYEGAIGQQRWHLFVTPCWYLAPVEPLRDCPVMGVSLAAFLFSSSFSSLGVLYQYFFPAFLIRHFEPTRRKPGHSPDPARLVSGSGTKAAPLLESGNRGRAILFVSYRNVSAALSLLNNVCNSIYSRT